MALQVDQSSLLKPESEIGNDSSDKSTTNYQESHDAYDASPHDEHVEDSSSLTIQLPPPDATTLIAPPATEPNQALDHAISENHAVEGPAMIHETHDADNNATPESLPILQDSNAIDQKLEATSNENDGSACDPQFEPNGHSVASGAIIDPEDEATNDQKADGFDTIPTIHKPMSIETALGISQSSSGVYSPIPDAQHDRRRDGGEVSRPPNADVAIASRASSLTQDDGTQLIHSQHKDKGRQQSTILTPLLVANNDPPPPRSANYRHSSHNPAAGEDARRLVRGPRTNLEWWDGSAKRWIPAVYHNDIRGTLIQRAAANGHYHYHRAEGTGQWNKTSFLKSQEFWSEDRSLWRNIPGDLLNKLRRPDANANANAGVILRKVDRRRKSRHRRRCRSSQTICPIA